jgi:hypothetical protein
MRRILLLSLFVGAAVCVDRSKFRTCEDASFCRRHRTVTSEPEVRRARVAATLRVRAQYT